MQDPAMTQILEHDEATEAAIWRKHGIDIRDQEDGEG